MKQLVIKPTDFPCRLSECPPGFFVFENSLCFKTEYGQLEAYCESGEYFLGGTSDIKEKGKLTVTPCEAKWEIT